MPVGHEPWCKDTNHKLGIEKEEYDIRYDVAFGRRPQKDLDDYLEQRTAEEQKNSQEVKP